MKRKQNKHFQQLSNVYLINPVCYILNKSLIFQKYKYTKTRVLHTFTNVGNNNQDGYDKQRIHFFYPGTRSQRKAIS